MKKVLMLIVFLASLTFIVFTFLQCATVKTKDYEEEVIEGLSDISVKGLKSELDKYEFPKDVTQRGQTALHLWENDICDPVPILIYAIIKKDYKNVPRMCMYYSDEDRDLVGFGIREVNRIANKEDHIMEETYPIFEHSSPPAVWRNLFDFEERTLGKSKNKESWSIFVNNPDAESHPSIISSIPDPNNIDILVWLYDRAGNQSKPVKAVNEMEWKLKGSDTIENEK